MSEGKILNLSQKMNALRGEMGEIIKKRYSENVKYKFYRLYDLYTMMKAPMVKIGVDLRILSEEPVRNTEQGADYYTSYIQQTRSGPRTVWVYEADLGLEWVNVDDPGDKEHVTLHLIGTNDSGPDKAKGAAWTYGLKYYLSNRFSVPMDDEEDPDRNDYSGSTVSKSATKSKQTSQKPKQKPSEKLDPTETAPYPKLSQEQVKDILHRAEQAGISRTGMEDWIRGRLKVEPMEMTEEDGCKCLKAIEAVAAKRKAKEEQNNA